MRVCWLLALVAGCRVGIAPGLTHRTFDGVVTSGFQAEVGAVVPSNWDASGLAGFLTYGTMRPVGETEGHAGWLWGLADLRYRRHFTRWDHVAPYWSLGAGIGDGSRGFVGGSHSELGIEWLLGSVSIDASLRYRLLIVEDGDLTRSLNVLQLGLSFGWATLQD